MWHSYKAYPPQPLMSNATLNTMFVCGRIINKKCGHRMQAQLADRKLGALIFFLNQSGGCSLIRWSIKFQYSKKVKLLFPLKDSNLFWVEFTSDCSVLVFVLFCFEEWSHIICVQIMTSFSINVDKILLARHRSLACLPPIGIWWFLKRGYIL